MQPHTIFALLALGATGVAPTPESRPPAALPSFSSPLEITHPLLQFPAPGHPAMRLMGNEAAGTFETSVFSPETRTVEWKGQRIECRVVSETESEDGEEVESSESYFAQADDGSVWYFGDTATFQEPGSVEKSWIVGGGGGSARPDVVVVEDPFEFLPAEIAPGQVWISEHVPHVAFEVKQLLAEDVPFATSKGQYRNCSVVGSVSEGDGLRILVYAPGVGLVYEATREDWQELLTVRWPSPALIPRSS